VVQKQQRQHSGDRFSYAEAQLDEQAERDERGEDGHQNVGAGADHNTAYGRVVFVLREDGPVGDPSADDVGGQHE